MLSVKVLTSLMWLNKRKRNRETIPSAEQAQKMLLQSLKDVVNPPQNEEQWKQLYFCDKSMYI